MRLAPSQGTRSAVIAALMFSGFGFRAAWSTWIMWKYVTVGRAALFASHGVLSLVAMDSVAGILCALNYYWFAAVVRSAAKVAFKSRKGPKREKELST